MESGEPRDLGAMESREIATHTSPQGEPLSAHPPHRKPSNRDRLFRDPLFGEVAVRTHAERLREPGLSPGGGRDRSPDLWIEKSVRSLRCRDRLDRNLTLHGGEARDCARYAQPEPQPLSSPLEGAKLQTEAKEPCLDVGWRGSEAARLTDELVRRLQPTPRQRKGTAAILPHITAALTQSLLAGCDVARQFEIRTARATWQRLENPSSGYEEKEEKPPLDMPPVENLKRNKQAKPALTDGSYLWWLYHPPAAVVTRQPRQASAKGCGKDCSNVETRVTPLSAKALSTQSAQPGWCRPSSFKT